MVKRARPAATAVRWFPLELKVRDAGTGGEETIPDADGVLEGYASVYGTPYNVGWGMKESITADAFSDSLRQRSGIVPVFYQHDWDNPIGHARATEDAHGLSVEAQLYTDSVERARSVFRGAAAGSFREWSIGFIPTTIRLDSDDSNLEHIDAGELLEVSVVVKGANPETEMLKVRLWTPEDEQEIEPEEVDPAIAEGAWSRLANADFRRALRTLMPS